MTWSGCGTPSSPPAATAPARRGGRAAPGGEPMRESLAAAVPVLREWLDPDAFDRLLADLRVHPVLTAHPTEARRRAVTEALRRIGVLLDDLAEGRLGASRRVEAERRLREEVDLLWRTAALRVQAM